MKMQFATAICVAMVSSALLSPQAFGEQKTIKQCEDEWRANRADNRAKGITQKDYVEKCRADSAATPPKAATPPAAHQKTVKQCEDEWRANRADNRAKGITQKDYVAKCRADSASTEPKTPPQTTPTPAATPGKPSTAPAARTAPTGANQFQTEAQAKSRCPTDTVVWVNLSSKIYHFATYSDYGKTKRGAYMCEKDTAAAGFRAAKNEKHP